MTDILGFTGHRPHHLGGDSEGVHGRLFDLAFMILNNTQPRRIISGMAKGWDMAVAEAAHSLDIPFIAAVPFEGQIIGWSMADITHYSKLLDAAAEVVMVTPGDWTVVAKIAYQRRNEWIVDNCDRLIALWDGTPSGTKNCIDYAVKVGRPWENVWSLWKVQTTSQRIEDMLS